MNAVLRVWWTFFTALPLQRWLGGVGAALCALLGVGGLLLQQPLWIVGLLVLFVLTVFPTLFASAAVFRALSAPHANQLLPHFRVRMLGAVLLLLATLLAIFALLLTVPSPAGRGLPFEQTGYAFAFVTALFLWMFAAFGGSRWWLVIPAALLILNSASTAQALLAALPARAWPTAAAASWIAFAVWYLSARRISPLVLVPRPPAGRWSRTDLGETVTRERALRALVTASPPGRRTLDLSANSIVGLIATALVFFFVMRAARLVPFTIVLWPFAFMIGSWAAATSVVHRSRLLWLRVPGPREAVRREIERALQRNLGRLLLVLVALAALYASPLVASAPLEVLAGVALAACASLFGTYAAFAAVPGGPLQITGFALLMALQLALLAHPAPSLTSAVIVTAAELAGALFFRALALRRWRDLDWLRVRPVPVSLRPF